MKYKYHPGIDLPGSGAHRQPVERRKAHRTFHASTVIKRAHRCAAAKMSDDDTPVRGGGRHVAQAARDVFVREPMKPVAPDTLGVKAFRNREMVRDFAVAAMKRRVEARDLEQFRPTREQCLNGREVIWLMQRRKRHVALETRQHRMIDDDRSIILRATMNHTMADGGQGEGLRLLQPISNGRNCGGNVRDLTRRVRLVDQWRAVAALGAKPRLRADPVHLSFDQPPRIAGSGEVKYLKLDARGAGVDGENSVHFHSRRRTSSRWRDGLRHRARRRRTRPCGCARNPRAM